MALKDTLIDLAVRYGFQVLGALVILIAASMLLALVMALDRFGFQVAPLVAGIGVAGLGVSFALQGC
jgi:hypothetical protein